MYYECCEPLKSENISNKTDSCYDSIYYQGRVRINMIQSLYNISFKSLRQGQNKRYRGVNQKP